ncbi:MAG: hypothetical protein VX777_02435 [Chlamydiota bacterium]|nr:hypothetical protein [Chlamydiota bacterium]
MFECFSICWGYSSEDTYSPKNESTKVITPKLLPPQESPNPLPAKKPSKENIRQIKKINTLSRYISFPGYHTEEESSEEEIG